MEPIHLYGQSADSQSNATHFQLKPVVIAVSIAIGMAGALAGCHDDDDNGSSGGGVGNNTINTSGGAASAGYGGHGDDITLYAGELDTIIDILTSGAGAPNPSTLTAPDASDLGANFLTVSASMTLPVAAVEPASGTAYQVADSNDCKVYISDGNGTLADEAPVTGIEIASGAMLTLEGGVFLFSSLSTCLRLTNDMDNDGGIDTAVDGADVTLSMDHYFATGTIDTSGVAEGADGGDIDIYAAGSIYNSGDITADGADSASDDAGDGGNIALYANGTNLWNSGELSSRGGNSTSGDGGDGNDVDVFLYASTADGSLISAGEIFADGGSGTTEGGDGEDVEIGVSGDSGRTDLLVTASIHVRGGAASGPGASAGEGDSVDLYNDTTGGEITLFGFNNLTSSGGAGELGGGSGGDVELYSDCHDIVRLNNEAIVDTFGGDTDSGYAGYGGDFIMGNCDNTDTISNSGAVDTSGGNATSGYGGGGGDIELYRDGGDGDISNTGTLTALGGDGLTGGNGGFIALYQFDGVGDVSNTAVLMASGGDGTNGGGSGGGIEIEIEFGDGRVTNSGALTASGGAGGTGAGGDGGFVEVEQESGDGLDPVGTIADPLTSSSTNTGPIVADGGTGDTGGDGGSVEFYSPGLLSDNHANISLQGGDGTQDGGHGGFVLAYGEPFTNSGDIDASGGNGTAGYGGDGGFVDMYSTGGPSGPSTDNTGSVNVAAGTGGAADGVDGVFTVDGVVVP